MKVEAAAVPKAAAAVPKAAAAVPEAFESLDDMERFLYIPGGISSQEAAAAFTLVADAAAVDAPEIETPGVWRGYCNSHLPGGSHAQQFVAWFRDCGVCGVCEERAVGMVKMKQ